MKDKNSVLANNRSELYHIEKNYLKQPRVFGDFLLFQIGRLYCGPHTVVTPHAHINLFELTIVTGGRGIVTTNGVAIPVERGDIYLSFPGDFHAIASNEDDPLKYDFCAFNTTNPEFVADFERIVENYMSADRRIIRDEKISSLVRSAITDIDGDRRYSYEMLIASFGQMTIRILRNFLERDIEDDNINVSDPAMLCYRLMNYIDTHICTINGLSEISKITNYNYSYLSSLFKRVTGGTLLDYYKNRRLETGCLLVLEGQFSISYIAELLNYSSIYTFSRAFKDKYGLSPEQYRKKIVKEEAVSN